MTKPIKENELSKQKTVRITAFSDVQNLMHNMVHINTILFFVQD